MAAADAFAGGIRLERPAGPAELFCFLLRDEVGGQVSVGMQIQRDVVLRGIDAVFVDGGRFGSRSFFSFLCGGFLIGCLRRFFGSFFCRVLRFGSGQSGRLGVLFGIVQDLGNLLDGLRGFFDGVHGLRRIAAGGEAQSQQKRQQQGSDSSCHGHSSIRVRLILS